MKRIVAALAAVLLLTGCGGGLATGAPAAGVICTFGARGADVQVQITNQSSCAADESALASDGQNWYPITALSAPGTAGSADGETLSVICTLAKGGSTITVMDAGGAYYGNSVCSAEEQDGWTSSP